MRISVDTRQRHEIVHWIWIWMLAVITMMLLTQTIAGQLQRAVSPSNAFNEETLSEHGWIGVPDRINERNGSPTPDVVLDVTIADILGFNRRGEFDNAVGGWWALEMAEGSVTWKHTGLGAAYLRMNMLDDAIAHLTAAIESDPTNAIAEYFMGQVRLEQSKSAPFWYDIPPRGPVRLAKLDHVADQPQGMGVMTIGNDHQSQPEPFKEILDRQAEHHLRRAIDLAVQCDLNQVIAVAGRQQPVIQLVTYDERGMLTVVDLMKSLGEENYVGNAHVQLGDLLVGQHRLLEAEEDYDKAQLSGVNVSDRFVDLGKRFESTGQSREASRVYVKALQGNPSLSGVLADAFRTLIDSM